MHSLFMISRHNFFHRLALSAVVILLAGCEPIDQRTFDKTAGLPPTPPSPPTGPSRPAPPPFLQIVVGTPEAEWKPAVTKATQIALARKPNVLFTVTAIVPRQESPSQQTQAMEQVAAGDERAVAEAMVAAAAPGYQIELQARAEGDGQHALIRVDVR